MKIFEIVIAEKNKSFAKGKAEKAKTKNRKLPMLFAGKDAKEAKQKAIEAFDNKRLWSIGRPNMILNTD